MICKVLQTVIYTLAFLFFVNSVNANEINGRVLSISSGDNFIMFSQEGEHVPVHLYGIAAPERNQPYGLQSAGFLNYLIMQQDVSVRVYSTDDLGVKSGVVTLGEKNINQEMIRQGYAWRHPQKCRKASFCVEWTKEQEKARSRRLGLWKPKEPIPPWEYQKNSR